MAAPALAQVNTERLRSDITPGFHGYVDGSLEYRQGNGPRIRLSAGARLDYIAEEIHRIFAHGSFDYGEKGDDHEHYLNRAFGHMRWTAMWHPHIGSEVFAQAQFDEFLRLNLRVLGGIGARFVLLDTDIIDLAVGVGYMTEYETLDLAADNSHPADSVNHRLTSYVSLSLQINERVSLNSTTYAQPKLDDPDDFRLLEEAGLEVSLVKHLTLVLALSVYHDNRPPDGVQATDLSFAPRFKVHW
jgi:putative salt-induced outer membrane protein YdiY